MVEFLPPNRLLVGGERAADLRHLRWGDRARPPVGVGHQLCQGWRWWVWVTLRRKARHNHSMRLASGSQVGVETSSNQDTQPLAGSILRRERSRGGPESGAARVEPVRRRSHPREQPHPTHRLCPVHVGGPPTTSSFTRPGRSSAARRPRRGRTPATTRLIRCEAVRERHSRPAPAAPPALGTSNALSIDGAPAGVGR
jgi:hypothetical protein